MNRPRFIALPMLLLVMVPALLAVSESAPDEDAHLLESAGIPSHMRGLKRFFVLRDRKVDCRQRVEALINQLGANSFQVRTRATRELIMVGRQALPYLQSAIKSGTLDLETVRRATLCIKKIENIGPEHVAAAARLLIRRQGQDAVPMLLDYLPWEEDEWAQDEIVGMLGRLLLHRDNLHPFLEKLVHSTTPELRALAGYILGGWSGLGQRTLVLRMLCDRVAEVHAKTADGLLGRHYLKKLADTAGEDQTLLKEMGVAASEDGLLTYLRKRTLTPADEENMRRLVRQLGAPSYKARTEASKKLVEYGPAAVPLLEPAVNDPSIEVARRAQKCLSDVKRGPGPTLSLAVVRGVARLQKTKTPEAISVLVHYFPFAENEHVQEEILFAGCRLAIEALDDAARAIHSQLAAALTSGHPGHRAMAAYVLGRVGTPEEVRAAQKHLQDKDAVVRLRAAQGCLAARDRSAVRTLIELLDQNDPLLVWHVEEILRGIAGDEAPRYDQTRTSYITAWQKWWQGIGRTLDIERSSGTSFQGLITVCQFDNAAGQPEGSIEEWGHDRSPRWKLTGLAGPMDAQVLPNHHVLIVENTGMRITERDLTGTIKWKIDLGGSPVSCQRLPNGHTFIGLFNELLEVNTAGKIVFRYKGDPSFHVFSARKLPNGHIVCFTTQGQILQLDGATSRKIRDVPAGPSGGWASAEALPNGRFLVATMANGLVRELDAEGKVHWQVRFAGAFRAVRLPNGHTVAASMTTRRVAAFNRAGEMLWSKSCEGRPWSIRFR
jgi:HEAT repeat protein